MFCMWIALAFTQLQFAKKLPLRARSVDLILLICICLLYSKLTISLKNYVNFMWLNALLFLPTQLINMRIYA